MARILFFSFYFLLYLPYKCLVIYERGKLITVLDYSAHFQSKTLENICFNMLKKNCIREVTDHPSSFSS